MEGVFTNKKRKRDDSSSNSSKKAKAVPKTAVDKSLARRIHKLEVDQEWKYTDNFLVNSLIPLETTPAWVLQCINTSVLGTAQVGQRVGTKIDNKLLILRMSLHQNVLNITDNRVRVILFWYKNSNGVSATPGTVFDLAGACNAPTYAMYNDQYRDSFKIISDELHELKPLDWNGTTTTIGDQISINKTFKLGRTTKYALGGGTNTYVDILDNSLWIAVMTSANSGAAQIYNPFTTISTRCYFVDS